MPAELVQFGLVKRPFLPHFIYCFLCPLRKENRKREPQSIQFLLRINVSSRVHQFQLCHL